MKALVIATLALLGSFSAVAAQNEPQPALIKQGEYLARAGDCVACHTAKGGKPFAGGLPMETPIGVIYSTNITPDKSGIGTYSFDDFDKAVRHGIAQNGSTFLSGSAPLEGWIAKNLRGDHKDGLGSWDEEQLVQFLKTGRSDRSAVFGGMSDVIVHSMQYMSESDLTAIARYLKSLPAVDPADTPHQYDASVADALWNGDDSKRGAAVYIDNCAACHRTDGHGYTRVFPALAGNPVLQSNDPTSLIHIVLKGGTLPATHTAPSTFTMPAFDWRLSDQEVADVVNFIRTSWGNKGGDVKPEDVKKLRE